MNLVAFFEGGLSYTELRNMPIPELRRVHEEAARIQKERERKV